MVMNFYLIAFVNSISKCYHEVSHSLMTQQTTIVYFTELFNGIIVSLFKNMYRNQ